jgi:p-aminobenzoyl-glutamate transporter AbgT
MYKSVSIRDSRLSLELNSSLWRLSWITFIFLPLTFLAGFFGMNVDTFKRSPPLKWYFIVAAPMMLLILGCWLVFRYLVPHQRGAGYHENISRESSKLKSSKLGRMDTMQHL